MDKEPASMVAVMRFFDMTLGKFRAEWAALSEESRTALRAGIGNGSLTY